MKFAPLMLCLLALTAAAPSAFAQYNGNRNDDRGRGPDAGGGLPGGSWVASCRRPEMDGPTLMAQCEDTRGRMRNSSIDVSSCSTGTVANRDGGLVCESPVGRGGNGLPIGSWSYTCRGGQMQGPILRAQCRDTRDRWRDTSIDVRTCASNRLSNRDGGLICD